MNDKLIKLIAELVLDSRHSMVYSKPLNESDDIFNKTKPLASDIQSYGLFGGSNNYNTYYEGKPEPPAEDEFIEPTFRLLSNCIVAKDYFPTEFPEEVLKASIPLIVGQTVNCDHETDIANAIGSVKDAYWQDAYTAAGVNIPGGINGVLKIDAKANPRIARGILMDPPSIHSNSVTVQFEWKPSHYENDLETFWTKFGQLHEDGTIVRRIATKIISYKETSLVSHGADPFAQKVDENGDKIVNPRYSGMVYYGEAGLSEETQKNLRSGISMVGSCLEYKDNKASDSFSQEKTIKKHKNMNDVISLSLVANLLGIQLNEGEKLSQEKVQEVATSLMSELQSLREKASNHENVVNSLNDEIARLNDELKKNDTLVAYANDHISKLREDALANYQKINGENADQAIVNLISVDATPSVLESLNKSYIQQLEERFPMKCSECGSLKVSRASSVVDPEDDDTMKNEDKTDKSVIDSINEVISKRKK